MVDHFADDHGIIKAAQQRGEMDKPKKTVKGFTVNRRCDSCGTRVDIACDRGDKCMLKCSQCGKEYMFYLKA
ncbi:MAG TPA: hypothetical protein PK250_17645 [Syntrophobacter fumaroxidans]|nr:hypothetical protein [Syntrophobacter fumaroxidans]